MGIGSEASGSCDTCYQCTQVAADSESGRYLRYVYVCVFVACMCVSVGCVCGLYICVCACDVCV